MEGSIYNSVLAWAVLGLDLGPDCLLQNAATFNCALLIERDGYRVQP